MRIFLCDLMLIIASQTQIMQNTFRQKSENFKRLIDVDEHFKV